MTAASDGRRRMIIERAYEEALNSAQPLDRLRDIMRRRLQRGESHDRLRQELEGLRRALQASGREVEKAGDHQQSPDEAARIDGEDAHPRPADVDALRRERAL